MSPRDKDPMEITRPPDGYRCDAHEAFAIGVSQRLTGVETKLTTLDSSMRDGFADIKGTLGTMASQRDSDVRRLATVAAEQSEHRGGLKVGAWIVPILIGVIIAIAGITLPMACSAQ